MHTETETETGPSPDVEAELQQLAETTDDDPTTGAPTELTTEPALSRSTLLRFAGPIVLLVLGIKALIFTFGALLPETIGDRTFAHFSDRFAMWNYWDGPHYLDIATHGYQTAGDPANFIVFFPGYPLGVAALNPFVPGGAFTAALVLSGIASIAATLLLAYLVRHDTGGDEAQATRAAWFLLIFPTAYFLHIPYTESLFLAFVFGAFLAARTGHWATAGIVGALAAFTRLNGLLLIPALGVEAYLQYRKTGEFKRSSLWILAIGVGTLIYLGINQHYFGDPLHFQDVQREHWHKYFANPYSSIHGMLQGMGGYKPADRMMFVIQELLFLAIGLGVAIWALLRSRASYGVWALLNVLLFASTSWIQSTPRYAITIFPIFFLLASIKRDWLSKLLATWSIATMMWFVALFALGKWAF